MGIGESYDDHGLVGRRYPFRDRRVRRVDRRYPLEVDVRRAELRADVADVVGHAPEDRFHDRLLRVTALETVAVHLLYPLQVDDGRDADLQVGILRDIDVLGNDRAVESFVEQQVDAGRRLFPVRERARLRAVALRLAVVVDVVAGRRLASLPELAERGLQAFEQVGFRAEMAEVVVALLALLQHDLLHAGAVVGVKGIALDECRVDALAAENLLERVPDRCRAGTGRTGNRDNGMCN